MVYSQGISNINYSYASNGGYGFGMKKANTQSQIVNTSPASTNTFTARETSSAPQILAGLGLSTAAIAGVGFFVIGGARGAKGMANAVVTMLKTLGSGIAELFKGGVNLLGKGLKKIGGAFSKILSGIKVGKMLSSAKQFGIKALKSPKVLYNKTANAATSSFITIINLPKSGWKKTAKLFSRKKANTENVEVLTKRPKYKFLTLQFRKKKTA